jgi:hypothetical protein
MLCARKVNMINFECQKGQYDKCFVPEKAIWQVFCATFLAFNIYHIDFSGTQHLSYWLFWHTTLVILSFLAQNTYHIDLSGIQIYNLGISVSCAPGSYYSSNTAKCTPCPIGQYQSSSGQTACTSCPGGQTFWHTTLVILSFLAQNTYHIDLSGIQHLSYWLFWHTTLTITQCARKVNMINVECQKGQYDKYFVPEKVNMISVLCQKRQYNKCYVPEKSIW